MYFRYVWQDTHKFIVVFAAFGSFLWTGVIFASFSIARKVELTMHLLKFGVRNSEKISEFSIIILVGISAS